MTPWFNALVCSFLLIAPLVNATEIHLKPGPHAVGYWVQDAVDPSRSFGPRYQLDGSRSALPLSRPVQIHLWYPAQRRFRGR